MQNKITAKDFFLHLGAIVTFYASTIALITLLFEAINFAYPKVTDFYQYYSPSISLQVAVLIVAFPLFLFLSWLIQKSYIAEPELREALVRRWLSYLTLFIAGGVVAGDLITVIYMFLDGQELTTGFLLKVLTLLVIAGGIFLYYIREIRNVITSGERNIWRVVALLVILGSIIIGFSVIGSPQAQRERRYDSQRTMDLQSIQWQIVSYWQQKGSLPATGAQLEDPISGYKLPVDPKTKESYETSWKIVGGVPTLELCANFDQLSPKTGPVPSMAKPIYTSEMSISARFPENWDHGVGRTCFTRTIDPQLYPPIKR